jgi:ankyrin repeat protein
VAWGFPHRLAAALQADPSLANARGGHGTLLHAAAYNGREASVRILLHFGADKHALSTDGVTPLQVALHRGHPELSALLS